MTLPVKPFVTPETFYMSADTEDKFTIAQANAKLNDSGEFIVNRNSVRRNQKFIFAPPEQIVPHVPQLVSVLRFVSQPLFAFASQFPKPALHAGTQRPPVHAVLPLAFVQATPQLPQFVSEERDASQPLTMLPSQLAKPALHEPSWHSPELQSAEAFA